jgi:tagatose 1,6-diphosphate aldolase
MHPTPITIGKYRGLQQCATPHAAIAVLALDHRNNLRNALNPAAPSSVSNLEMSEFKIEVIQTLAPHSSAVLLDPEVGAAQCIAAGALPGSTGLVISIEMTGYTGDPGARKSQILPGWSVEKVRRMGASAVKMLAYYHPDAPTAADIETLVRNVADDCQKADIPFFLEPLSYSPDPVVKKLSPAERRRVVIETARRLVMPGVDVLKAEFPLDARAEPDETVWAEACQELSSASAAPWILLSASVDFDTYLRQVTTACQCGASGVAVGRAVWQEAPTLKGHERSAFLRSIAQPRMARLTALVDALAKPWTDFYLPTPVDDTWYRGYSQ